MQQQRYNVFNQIHKGLRGMLYDTALRLQQTDFSQPQASQAIEPLQQLLLFFGDHAEHEDRFILPHIHKHSAQLVEEFEKDHQVDHRLTQALFDHIRAWKEANSASRREVIGQQILFAFNDFIAFNLYHMNKRPCCWISFGSIIATPTFSRCNSRFFRPFHPRRCWPRVAG